jgi:glutaredoxin
MSSSAAGPSPGDGVPTPVLEYVTLPYCRDCSRFEDLLAAVIGDYPGVELRAVDADSSRGRALSIEQGILHFPVIVLEGAVIGVESMTEVELRSALAEARQR